MAYNGRISSKYKEMQSKQWYGRIFTVPEQSLFVQITTTCDIVIRNRMRREKMGRELLRVLTVLFCFPLALVVWWQMDIYLPHVHHTALWFPGRAVVITIYITGGAFWLIGCCALRAIFATEKPDG
jgi:hypothetical protein